MDGGWKAEPFVADATGHHNSLSFARWRLPLENKTVTEASWGAGGEGGTAEAGESR